MQVYHRRHYTCLPIWSDLSLPLLPLPFPPTAVAPWDHPSDAKQLLTDEFRNSHRLVAEGSLRAGEHTHHCDWCHWTLPLFTSDRGPFAGHQLAKIPVHQHSCTGLLLFRCSLPIFAFPYLAEVLLDGRPPSSFSGFPPITVYFIWFPSCIVRHTKVSRGTLASMPRRNTVGTWVMVSDNQRLKKKHDILRDKGGIHRTIRPSNFG